MATYSGTPTQATTGQTVTAAFWNQEIYDVTVALTGAWNAWTPQIDQGASSNVAKTIAYADYVRVGKYVTAQTVLSLTAAGTSGSEVTVTLPVSRAYSGSSSHVVGTAQVIDSGANVWLCAAMGVSGDATRVKFVPTGTSTGVGASPNAFALASGDLIAFSVTYEAA